VVHHERGQILFQTLDSVRRQSLPSTQVEVVLVDDGSVTPPALAALDTLATWPEFSSGRWLLLRRPARYLGAARNVAARRARGLFLVFLDDDNLLKPHALATLVGAARASGADILTMPNEKWPSLSPPPDAPWGTPQRWAAATERWLPLGAAPAVGIFRNCFGDANAMVRARVFAALGGFTEDPQIGHEDWELWARAVLRSFRLEVLPEPLYWYRLGAGGMLAKSIGASQSAREQREANFARSLRPYLQRLEGWPEEQELVRSAHGARMAMPQRETERVRPGVE
jgi:glycosyltransferase involved in cell wall biosynthesis